MKIKPLISLTIVGALMLIAVFWRQYGLPDATDRLVALKTNGLYHQVEELPLDPWEKEFMGAAQAIKLLANVRGQLVVLTAIDGTHNRHAVHDPNFCFIGAGWQQVESRRISMVGGDATAVLLQKDGKRVEALYWFTDGDTVFSSPLQYWWNASLRRLTLGKSGSEPILILLFPALDSAADWEDLLRNWPTLRTI